MSSMFAEHPAPRPDVRGQQSEPIRIGKIFEPLPGISMNREPHANRRDFLTTAPNRHQKTGKLCRDSDLHQNFVGTN